MKQRFKAEVEVRMGEGIAFVRRALAENVLIARRHRQQARGLVVVVDGDGVGREQRCRELNEVLKVAGKQPLGPAEKIAVCVPTRTIETWEVWFCDRNEILVDESTDYKAKARRDPEYAKRSVKAWFETPSPEELKRVPSLSHARNELKRLVDLADI